MDHQYRYEETVRFNKRVDKLREAAEKKLYDRAVESYKANHSEPITPSKLTAIRMEARSNAYDIAKEFKKRGYATPRDMELADYNL